MNLLKVNCVLCAVKRDLKGSEDYNRIMAADVSFESTENLFFPVFHVGSTKFTRPLE